MSDYYAPAEDVLPLFAAARRTDPPTSHAAAARVPAFRSGHHRAILEALAAGPAGKTEIGSRCGLTEQQVARRMHELIAAGVVERDGETTSASGGREARYRVAGRNHLR